MTIASAGRLLMRAVSKVDEFVKAYFTDDANSDVYYLDDANNDYYQYED